jgi:anti-anti-sigma factor
LKDLDVKSEDSKSSASGDGKQKDAFALSASLSVVTDEFKEVPRALRASSVSGQGAIIAEMTSDERVVILRVEGRFSFGVHEEFRRAYQETWRPGLHYVLDMRSVEYLDSSALGMLLLMREYVGEGAGLIRILGCSAPMKDVFLRARFDQFFTFR